jgi:hypothetical protein
MQTPSPEVRPEESQPTAAQAISPVERHLRSRYQAAAERGPFVPLLLAGLALAGWFGLQGWLLFEERSTLQATHAAQQQTVDNAAKLRQSLDAIAADTQRLADAGNPNARLLVEELRKRGITINPNAPAAPAASEAKK